MNYVKKKRTAVVLVGLGEPSGPKDVVRYKESILGDPFVRPHVLIEGLRPLTAKVMALATKYSEISRFKEIMWKRCSFEAARFLAERLGSHLNEIKDYNTRAAIAMRYGEPSIPDVVAELKMDGVLNFIFVPLFPHYAPSTVGTIAATIDLAWMDPSYRDLRYRIVREWHNNTEFIKAWSETLVAAIDNFPADRQKGIHLLFCARAVVKGFSKPILVEYSDNLLESIELIMAMADGKNPFSLAYHSPFGKLKFEGRSVEDELIELGKKGVEDCLIIPISFVYDNVETLVDIDRRILSRSAEFRIDGLSMISPPLNSERFVKALASLV